MHNFAELGYAVFTQGLLCEFTELHAEEAKPLLQKLKQVARDRKNTFDALVKAARVCSLRSMSHALYDVGGEYRRKM
jgi:methylmalonyl-CoA mutase